MKQSTFPDLDKALSECFRKVRAMNIPVSGPLLQEKAQYFAEQLGHETFKSSNGFLDKLDCNFTVKQSTSRLYIQFT